MSTDGILEYQGTKRVLFRGDTSNIVFDTRTTSLGIGVTGSNNPSSNLYITGNAYVTSDIGVGGVLTMGTVNVVARHDLEAVTGTGNTTPLTIEFTNPTTSLVASGNVEVGGNVVAGYLYGDGSNISGISSNLDQIVNNGNVTSNTVQFSNAITSLTATSNIEVAGFVGSSGTGALTVPTGTTEQQPTGVAGMIRFNSTLNRLEVYNGTVWQGLGGISATGGTVTTSGGYKIHTFTDVSDTFTVISSGEGEYLVVAGGGGGSNTNYCGGGGAGGMLIGTIPSLAHGTYNITVGGGGATGTNGSVGSDSQFNTIIANGGGGGGGVNSNGLNGGSGGGGGYAGGSTAGNGRVGGTGVAGQGNNGGRGNGVNGYGWGGGGGGAGAAGTTAKSPSPLVPGDGGNGLQSSITGTATYYAGGAGGRIDTGGYSATGGLGGGGSGGSGSNSNGTEGGINTGGGGGPSKAGGSGIVVIRYLI